MSKLPPWIMTAEGRMIYTPSGDRPWEPQLTPGANLAKQRGCTCSRLDNKWGEGTEVFIPIPDGEIEGDYVTDIEFSIQPGCPLHDARSGDQDQQRATGDLPA